jgi:hypothetical protein
MRYVPAGDGFAPAVIVRFFASVAAAAATAANAFNIHIVADEAPVVR